MEATLEQVDSSKTVREQTKAPAMNTPGDPPVSRETAEVYSSWGHKLATVFEQHLGTLETCMTIWSKHYPDVPFPGVPFMRLKSIHERMGKLLKTGDVKPIHSFHGEGPVNIQRAKALTGPVRERTIAYAAALATQIKGGCRVIEVGIGDAMLPGEALNELAGAMEVINRMVHRSTEPARRDASASPATL